MGDHCTPAFPVTYILKNMLYKLCAFYFHPENSQFWDRLILYSCVIHFWRYILKTSHYVITFLFLGSTESKTDTPSFIQNLQYQKL
jgi:hypothetical protein